MEKDNVRAMLQQLIDRGTCRNEEEAIERALETLISATKP
jgi:hypothetical protein